MKKIVTFLFVSIFSITLSFGCTTFFINKNGQLIFGRNYDWVTGNGMVCTNQRGLSKTSAKTKDGATINWVAKYGSITFNQYGKEFPTGGMNEKGLVVELMWLDGTKYPAADKRPAIDVLQWIQYQLDNCHTVDELIATDKLVRIASTDNPPLHYLVADATGNAATIEFLDGKMKVHQGNDLPFPVLTNDDYASSLEQIKAGTTSSAANSFSFTNNSIDRFTKACTMVNQYMLGAITGSAIDYSFTILDKVAQGSHTKWSIVYDLTNRKIHFKTLGYASVKNVAFAAFDFRCSTASKTWNMNQAGTGDIARLFRDFSLEINSGIVNKSFDESNHEFSVNKEARKQTWEYPTSISCLKSSN